MGKKQLYGVKKRIRIYKGQYYDQETGLHYNYHRYYDPSLGRYLRVDPLRIANRIVGTKIDQTLFHGIAENNIRNSIIYRLLIGSRLLTNPQEQNLYSYTINNPTNLVDPKGLSVIVIPMPPPPPPGSTKPGVGIPSMPFVPPPDGPNFELELCLAICDGKYPCQPGRRKVCKTLCYFIGWMTFIDGL